MARGSTHVLVVVAGSRWCALPLAHVVETMRPLPVAPVAGTNAVVLGLAIVRGAPTPVVDLAACLGETSGELRRYVTLDVDGRRVSLAVSEIVGVRELDPSQLAQWPPLLGSADAGTIEALGTLDAAFLAVLRAASVVNMVSGTGISEEPA